MMRSNVVLSFRNSEGKPETDGAENSNGSRNGCDTHKSHYYAAIVFEGRNMGEIKYQLLDNQLKAEDFIRLKVATGFRNRPIDQVEKALHNNLFDVVAVCNEEVVGMGRLVGDGVMYWYLQEIIILPEYQGKGIGTSIVNRLLEHIKQNTEHGTFASIGLTAAEGKDTFYERFGFDKSLGMTKYIEG